MIKEIDARGENCPKPFIMTKKALDELETGRIITIVDNEVAKENVLKLVESLGLKYQVKEDQGDFYIEIEKGDVGDGSSSEASDTGKTNNLNSNVVLFTKDKMGHGNDELGHVLIKGYIYTLTELDEKPKALLFVNSGILLTTGDAETIDDLKKLEAMGVEILSCGTCLDYYDVKDSLKVGEIANMYLIADAMNRAANTITL